MPKADYTLDGPKSGNPSGSVAVLSLKGDWVITQIEGVTARLTAALKGYGKVQVKTDALEGLDTAGAFFVHSLLKDRLDGDIFAGQDNFKRLYDLVSTHAPEVENYHQATIKKRRFWLHPVLYVLSDIGRLTMAFWREFWAQTIFLGHVITLLLLSIGNPKRIRIAALVSLMQRAGIEAIPIVMLTNFFIGGVLAFLGVIELQQFGVSIYAVEMVGMAVLREFAPVIAAVLIAGRSASSFAAEIGSMKMNQEIDAMEVMSVDPYEALVLPRVLALVIMTPLVSFLGAMAGLAGGAMIVWASLNLGPQYFVQRLTDNVPYAHFLVGMSKTPFFAITIAIIGCRKGMTVKGDVISLGRQVTAAVVQAIFIVFLLNAMFALLFRALNV